MSLTHLESPQAPFDSHGAFYDENAQKLMEAIGEVISSYESMTGRRIACNMSIMGDTHQKYQNIRYMRMMTSKCHGCGGQHHEGLFISGLDVTTLLSVYPKPSDPVVCAEAMKQQVTKTLKGKECFVYFGENLSDEHLDHEMVEIFSKGTAQMFEDVSTAEFVTPK
jgi:hypothetical protein